MTSDQPQTPTHLPTLLPSVSLVLQRTQTTLKLLSEVVEEATPKYWHDKGYQHLEQGDFDQSTNCFNKFLTFRHLQYTNRYREFNGYLPYCITGLALAFEGRSKLKYYAGDLEGSSADSTLRLLYLACARELNQEGYCIIDGVMY